jgi:transcriptional regulator with XRE-family HTH domain
MGIGDDNLPNAEIIGNILKELRTNKGLTQEQLSGLAVLDRTHYSKLERGLRSPTIETLFKIANALDMKPHEIIKIIENRINIEY